MTSARPELISALGSMEQRPSELLSTVNFFVVRAGGAATDESTLVSQLSTSDVNDAARVRFQLLLSRWDSTDDPDWTQKTKPHGADRRGLVHDLLGFGSDAREDIDRVFPRDPGAIVIEGDDGDWQPWYAVSQGSRPGFYWDAYSSVLLDKGMPSDAVAKLDSTTTAVVRKLADPTRDERYQAKGLVVGYVQSGKTANFTGVVAKAIDAGYRLIVVLTGTVEILRKQTQRRMDMELVGVENILVGIDENDSARIAQTDYASDQDWPDKFLRHGINLDNTDGVPTIRRLSTFTGDYKKLKQGLSALDFRSGRELIDRGRPLFDPVNLFGSDVRLAVVKKNSTVLKKLVEDLGDIRADLGEIPTLIIDDEADQASVNTKRNKSSAEEKERTAVNRRISDLLGVLSRAQYVGYTATPFANVFIDPDDSEDIFPKDFIISLDRPEGYMGAADFHDLDVDRDPDASTIENSNEKCHVRGLYATDDADRDAEMLEALDSFVLSGAIKLYRASKGSALAGSFRHHTMLVHESVRNDEHAALAERIRELWRRAGYDSPAGMQRLRALYDNDVAPVTAALHRRASSQAARLARTTPSRPLLPESFDVLENGRWVGKALDRIQSGVSPVIVVNGDREQDYTQDALDFMADDVWKILVGGAKLSRGFTVEGLTVSYYTRRTMQADSMMQMGRWFGFRPGYRDLVRLFIGRNVPAPGGRPVDLFEAFEGIVRDEEDFRAELLRYSATGDSGNPGITPREVPPMVFQAVPWLKPTATSKMYNAELVIRGAGGALVDFPRQPERENGEVNARHFHAAQALLEAADQVGNFGYDDDGVPRTFDSRYGMLPAAVVRDVVARFAWLTNYDFAPHLSFLDEAIRKGSLTDFVVLVPVLTTAALRSVGDVPDVPLIKRVRRPRGGFSGSSFRQRAAAETIAGGRDEGRHNVKGGDLAVALHTPTRAAILLSFAYDVKGGDGIAGDSPMTVEPSDVATLFSWALPYAAAPNGRAGFKTRSGSAAIVDAVSESPRRHR